ncbi:glycosyltransferase family 8 protein [Halorhodospira halophila]|uniref:glycosyltransferase family 8 protein n=1 Tax=Halorhodospira halophila TaxID=1053 RepID=UPI001912D9D5|nr:glycosyltransferase family 8 protein [Halorhodospira halophila]MBK5943880.1 hypothetical protein [Halorhodospira halophila]
MAERTINSKNRIHLLLCANNGFAQHAAVTLASTLINNPEDNFNVTVVGDLSRSSQENLRIVSNLSANTFLRFLTLSEIWEIDDNSRIPEYLPTQGEKRVKGAYSVDIYTRLLISRIYSEKINKVLYLDSDIVVDGSLRPLWETNIEPYPVAGVRVPYFDRNHLPNLSPGDPYINSGVLLYNLPQWRRQQCERRCLDFLRKHSESVRDPDQDALNETLRGNIFFLEKKWNTFGAYAREEHAELDKRYRPVIYHYNGANKPWLYMSNHPQKDLYYRYLRETPWKNYTPPDKTLIKAGRKVIASLFPTRLRRLPKKFL